MKLLDTHIQSFGKLQDKTISFGDGIHLIYGDNEAGKTTFHTFLQSMLFGMERGRGRASGKDTFSRYLPWESGGVYGGDLRYEYQAKVRTIRRSFLLEPLKDELPEELGLTENRYKNTISIGQLSLRTDKSLAADLKNHLVNLTLGGDESIDIPGAIDELKNKKKQLEKQLVPTAKEELSTLSAALLDLEKELRRQDFDNTARSIQKEQQTLKTQIKEKRLAADRIQRLLTQGKAALNEHGFTSLEALKKRRQRMENAYDTFIACEMSPFPLLKEGLVLPAYIISMLFLLATCFIIMRGDSFLFSLPCFGGYLLFGLISRQAEREEERRLWKAKSMEYIQKELEEILYREEITEENYEEYMQELSDYENLFQKTADSAALMERKLEQLVALQEKAARLTQTQNDADSLLQKQEALLLQYDELERRLQAAKETLGENERLQEEIGAVTLALTTLEELAGSFQHKLTPELNETASRILSELTFGRYSAMTIEKDLTITLTCDRREVTPDKVSRGTLDLTYLAFRLALIPLFFKEEFMPLIFDDAFVCFDDKRLTRVLQYLSENYPGQILLFTCQNREEQILKEQGIAFRKIIL